MQLKRHQNQGKYSNERYEVLNKSAPANRFTPATAPVQLTAPAQLRSKRVRLQLWSYDSFRVEN